MMDLRPYQAQAVNALWNHISTKESNPCVVLPTGAGKTHLLAKIASDIVEWGGRAIFVTHVKELIEQGAGHIQKLAPNVPFGIYSAGLNSREYGYPITLAGIQSVYEKSSLFGHVDLVVIDEAHRIPADGEGMYRTFIRGLRDINNDVRLIGLTATPYRTQSGIICRPENLLNEICYEVGIRELIRDGYLCPLKSKAGREKPSLDGVGVRAGEFVQDQLESVMNTDRLVSLACLEILEKTESRKSVLIFCVGIDHANSVVKMMRDMGIDSVGTIFGDTPDHERAQTIKDFRDGRLKYLVNVNVLTTGFDAPNTDCVAILRPTMSPGLWYQMCGRGFRIAPEKKSCLILDFGGNVLAHGPVDCIRPPRAGKESPKKSFKDCPECQEIVPYTCDICPDCGFAFEKKEPQKIERRMHSTKAGEEDILSDNEPKEPKELEVTKVHYWRHKKRGSGDEKPPTLWVQYECGISEFNEWVCFEHQGFARQKAMDWWKTRTDQPIPTTIEQALIAINAYGIQEPKKIRVKWDGKWWRIEKYFDLSHMKKESIVDAVFGLTEKKPGVEF